MVVQAAYLQGTSYSCGQQYGELYAEGMRSFLESAIRPDSRKRAYANRCIPYTQRDAPSAFRFIRGMARGAMMALEDIMLLTLHEEIYHQPHCSAILAHGEATRTGKTLIGQNWDWTPEWKDYLSVLSLNEKDGSRTLSCNYPGLWKSAWVNEHGAAIMWTGGGYFPSLPPRVGAPTYAILAEASRYRNTQEIAEYLSCVRNAGSFIFFIGDPREGMVYEAANGTHAIERSDLLTRANHFELGPTKQASKQRIPSDMCTKKRSVALNRYLQPIEGSITASNIREALSMRQVYTPKDRRFATHASLFSMPEQRALLVRSGGQDSWKTFSL
jgi:hypothetical protein